MIPIFAGRPNGWSLFLLVSAAPKMIFFHFFFMIFEVLFLILLLRTFFQ